MPPGMPDAERDPADLDVPSRHGPVLVAWSLVAVQAMLLLVLVLAPGRPDWSSAGPGVVARIGGLALSGLGLVGIVVAATSLGKGMTASPLPNEAAQLRTHGLYAVVRHPIYTFLLLFAAGRVLDSPSLVRALAFVALAVLLNAKARWEEARLTERFPDYADYAAATPRFIPRRPG